MFNSINKITEIFTTEIRKLTVSKISFPIAMSLSSLKSVVYQAKLGLEMEFTNEFL